MPIFLTISFFNSFGFQCIFMPSWAFPILGDFSCLKFLSILKTLSSYPFFKPYQSFSFLRSYMLTIPLLTPDGGLHMRWDLMCSKPNLLSLHKVELVSLSPLSIWSCIWFKTTSLICDGVNKAKDRHAHRKRTCRIH